MSCGHFSRSLSRRCGRTRSSVSYAPARIVDAEHQSFLSLAVTIGQVAWIDRAIEVPRTSTLTLNFSLRDDDCCDGTFALISVRSCVKLECWTEDREVLKLV